MHDTGEMLDRLSLSGEQFKKEVVDYFANAETDRFSPLAVRVPYRDFIPDLESVEKLRVAEVKAVDAKIPSHFAAPKAWFGPTFGKARGNPDHQTAGGCERKDGECPEGRLEHAAVSRKSDTKDQSDDSEKGECVPKDAARYFRKSSDWEDENKLESSDLLGDLALLPEAENLLAEKLSAANTPKHALVQSVCQRKEWVEILDELGAKLCAALIKARAVLRSVLTQIQATCRPPKRPKRRRQATMPRPMPEEKMKKKMKKRRKRSDRSDLEAAAVTTTTSGGGKKDLQDPGEIYGVPGYPKRLPDGPLSEEAVRALLAGYEAGRDANPMPNWFWVVCILGLMAFLVAFSLKARAQERRTFPGGLMPSAAPVAEVDLEAQLLDGKIDVPTETDHLRTQAMALQVQQKRLLDIRAEDLRACRALGAKLAKAKATATELKNEPSLVYNENCLPPALTFPNSVSHWLRASLCRAASIGAVALQILMSPNGFPMAVYVEMTRSIGEVGGGRSLANAVVERAGSLIESPCDHFAGCSRRHRVLEGYGLPIKRPYRR
eukprot:s1766_g4.t2